MQVGRRRIIAAGAVVAVACLLVAWRHARLNNSTIGDEPDQTAGTTEQPLPNVQGPAIRIGAIREPRMVVEKAARRLTLYDAGKAVKTYRVALGRGRADKVREGDGCTPEGQFYVCVKNPRSRFTLSLGLSYPNIEDAGRGLRDRLIDRAQHDAIVGAIRRKRQPPWYTPLGGEIMIHGGGSGRDWTAGCVALDDEVIKELYRVVPLGTPVEVRP